MTTKMTIYDAVGEEAGVRAIVEAFYPRVQAHPLLGPLFPEDITPVMDKQTLFLTQFFGGPMRYSDQYGHPMMRARHMPFPINRERALAWLECMRGALEELGMNAELRDIVLDRLSAPAFHFINTEEEDE